MKNRPLKRATLKQLESIVTANDTNEAVLKLITELLRHYENAIMCYEKLEKYEKHPIIKVLRKIRLLR